MKKFIACFVALLVIGLLPIVTTAQDNPGDPWYKAYQNQSVINGQVDWYVATYSFAKDGGAVGNIDLDIKVPTNAVVMQGIIDVIAPILPQATNYTSALYLQSAGDLLAATTNGLGSTGIKACVPVDTAATAIKMTADRELYLTRAGAAITSGVFKVWIKAFRSFD